MRQKWMTVVIISVLLGQVGCQSIYRGSGPKPTQPKFTITINIDSIPSGADVYAIESDGQLGKKIGATPFVHTVGVAGQEEYWEYVEPFNSFCYTNWSQIWAWGAGAVFETDRTLFLKIALAKGEYMIGYAKKEIYHEREGQADKTLSLTVPLQTIQQANFDKQIQVQQEALQAQQNQNITIQNQKDGLDNVNSGLDALLKLQGLGAFR